MSRPLADWTPKSVPPAWRVFEYLTRKHIFFSKERSCTARGDFPVTQCGNIELFSSVEIHHHKPNSTTWISSGTYGTESGISETSSLWANAGIKSERHHNVKGA
jgi:hypothetical protein